jgi:hypothetical protein
MNVAVLGANGDPEKYANLALRRLKAAGHRVFAVNPKVPSVDGERAYAALSDIPEPIDTVTVYVGARVSTALADDILRKRPRRLIFNPGAENPELARRAEQAGIRALEACTLVMLSTENFERA